MDKIISTKDHVKQNEKLDSIFFIIKKIETIGLLGLLTLCSPAIAEIKGKTEKNISNNFEINKEKIYEQKLLQIVNINKMSPEIVGKAFDSIKYWEKEFDISNIPQEIKIPLQSICINPNNNINIITKFRDIHYLPNVDFAYQLSFIYHEKLKEYGENTPSIVILLGLLSQETGIRNVPGDGHKSKGYGQLHTPTAEYLLKANHKEIFAKYFYLDSEKNLHFHGKTEVEQQQNMIKTIIDILVLEKGYKKGDELLALARYNGSQNNVEKYAYPVISKAISYAIFLAAVSNNTFGYDQGMKSIENIILEENIKAGRKINFKIIRDTYEQNVKNFSAWRNNPKEFSQNKDFRIEKKSIQLKYGVFSYTSFNEQITGNPYIIPEKGKTIFSYFRENTREAVQYHNSIATEEKEKIEVFYYELINNKKEKHVVSSKEEMIQKYNEGYMIYASPDKNKIYINPKNNLYYYEGTEDRVTTIHIDNINDIKNQGNK